MTNVYSSYYIIDGKVLFIDEDEKVIPSSYEALLEQWIQENTPPAVTTKEISNALRIPYDTIQPKLKNMAEDKKIQLSKKARSVGEIGRRKYAWSRAD